MHSPTPPNSSVHLQFVQACFVLLLGFAVSASAQPSLTCTQSNQPAATLLLPYFEVDLDVPEGRNTIFSVGNTGTVSELVRVVVWTNWGHPVLSFDATVPTSGLRMFDLRRVLEGQLPTSFAPVANDDGHYASCTAPVSQPETDFDAVTSLLLGEAAAQDGLCYAGSPAAPGRATGYVTIDVVQDCSGGEDITPKSDGYFGDCASGLAGNDNVLWGNLYRIDSLGDSAQGEQLVSVTADQTRFGTPAQCVDPPCGNRIGWSFYRDEAQGNRTPLPTEYRTHFMMGQNNQTDIVIWAEGTTGPAPCGEPFGGPDLALEVSAYSGEFLGELSLEGRGQSFRLALDEFGSGSLSGVMRVVSASSNPVQMWVGPLLTAQNRYSVGLAAIATRDPCGGQ